MTLTPEEQAEALVFLDLAMNENERLRASVERLAEALSELVSAVSVVHGQKQDAERFLDARTNAQAALAALRAKA